MKLVKTLDYDYGKRKYSLIISATDNGIPQLKNQTELQIDVEDVDDRAPTFTKADYYGNISLEAKVGSAIATDQLIQAMDGDPGVLAQIVYSIEGDSGNYFQIDKSSGAVHLAKPLPKRSPLSSNKLILKAAQRDDPEKAASATLHLQVLDAENAEPSFNPCLYNASLLENSPSGAQVVRLRASDPDEGANGRFTYYLVDGTSETAAFSVDPDSGQIVVANTSALDRELTPIITIQSRLRTFINNQSASSAVSATSDRGDICRTATITVRLLDDNDNTPIFDRAIYRFTISDKALNGSVVGSVSASDADEGENSAVHYGQLEHEFDADPNAPRFKGVLMPDGSFEIVLVYNARPTYRPLYRLNLEAIDGGRHSRSSRTRIEISVNLSSTHVPVFDTDDFSTEIDDDLKNRSPVLKARANDPDAVSENFPNTHLPVFEKDDYSTDIDEDLKNGSPVLKVSATDPDEGEGGEFTYMLMSDSTAFVIDPVTGWISVNDSSQLDRERHRWPTSAIQQFTKDCRRQRVFPAPFARVHS
uniref:Cadherin domain-containing protein n=1 Tax=Plectus sambesii TaxID=2011161 RepID=A0A914VBD8_9BILA